MATVNILTSTGVDTNLFFPGLRPGAFTVIQQTADIFSIRYTADSLIVKFVRGSGTPYIYLNGEPNGTYTTVQLFAANGTTLLATLSDFNFGPQSLQSYAEPNNSEVFHFEFANVMTGGGGADMLRGSGSDIIYNGGLGNDVIYHGLANSSSDLSHFHGGGGLDTLRLVSGSNDSVLIDEFTSIERVVFADAQATLDRNASFTIIDNGNGISLPAGFTVEGDANSNRIEFFLSKADATLNLSALTFVNWVPTANAINVFSGDIVTVDGSNAAETIVGTAFADSIFANNGANVVSGGGGDDVLSGGADVDQLVGDGGSDSLFGHGGADSLSGGLNSDILAGGAGADALDGGADSDFAHYATNKSSDPNDFTLNVIASLANTAVNTNDAAGDTYTLIENLSANSGDDHLIGNASANILIGDRDFQQTPAFVRIFGNDILDGGDGSDTAVYTSLSAIIFSGTISVNLSLAGGQDTGGWGIDTLISIENLQGGDERDAFTGNGDANRLDGRGGNDALSGAGGIDVLLGGDGNDTLIGGTGDDDMSGGAGNDTFNVDSSLDIVREAVGFGTQDTIVSIVNVRLDTTTTAQGVEHVALQGSAGLTAVGTSVFNILNGNSGANYLAGNGGNDTVNGGGGNDRVQGGDGKDTLTGGGGDDAFLYTFIADSGGTQPRRDVITDFSQVAGNNDWIDLALTDANGALGGNQAFVWRGTAAFTGAAGELRYFQDAANSRTIIEGNVRVDAASPGPEFSIELTGLKTLTAGASNAFDIIV